MACLRVLYVTESMIVAVIINMKIRIIELPCQRKFDNITDTYVCSAVLKYGSDIVRYVARKITVTPPWCF